MITDKKIFVSSTCFDLIDFRAEIKEYLESTGFIPIMSDQNNSEFITLPNENSIETCLVNLRSCNIVIFALSKRYGGNLKNVGFGDYSATHLEYLEAKKHNKRILFFVRDRLLADFNHYQKTKNPSGLIWIDKDNIKLFEVISDRKTLSNTPQDNWILPFNSSIDVKDRLSIELRTEMKQIRLDRLIESGNLPFLTVWGDAIDIPNSLDVRLNLEVTNVGNQVAIGPLLVLFRAKDYQEVLRDNLYMDPTSSNVKNFNSLLPSGTFKLPTLPIKVDKLNDEVHLVASVLYKTIHGDLLTDVTEISIKTVLRPKMKMAIRYTTKHYLQEDTYEKIIAK